ncbi:MAG: carboxymuconolactone decarboxylase family protein [Archaeoglobus sp.]|nr:carboxymuconolactone decarboxylase family protein [Archaeoglobus sp.]
MPDVEKAFMELHSAVFSDGKLMVKQEELIAVGISVAIRRSSCIRSHGSKAIEAGAFKEEILEAASVALIMRGGAGRQFHKSGNLLSCLESEIMNADAG